ncbi:hypothetical protein SARC_03391 [Sphaeroforma arctica JP610]|uniref:Uncharacterized protein n=1 Tax=Sphaeroforma arctica JP610 TaxID=667725 RepID=A0A0L0G824_9EUKA|nr:hypothetical protein SARC_03391 [Sphaeroforma arctica JP610]KNC84398.1 hypothetical protein SARC_03391 [Sphaeroforma arctica JP610]|eukprot:XP_014158300.1 hypothetical protein SARC_03391 [Sphaeroforma arctica JP610]
MAESDFLKQVVSGIRMSAKKQQETFHNTKHNIVVPVASGGGVDENESTDIEYKISVYTGDIPNASTSAKVFITLYRYVISVVTSPWLCEWD